MRTIALLAFIVITACGQGEDELSLLSRIGSEEEYIKTGVACGLCGGVCMDTLVVTPDKLYYKKTIWGEGKDKTEIIEQAFTQQGWNNLVSLVDLEEFNGLDMESCARCFDGCDYWLGIRSAGTDNMISFAWNDFPAEADTLTKALNAIKESLNE